jgi:hypothetical protein
MATNQLSLQIEGTEENDGNVTLTVLLKQLESFRKAVIETDRIVTGGQSLDFLVTDLRHSSPAFCAISGKPKKNQDQNRNRSDEVFRKLYSGIVAIQEKRDVPKDYDFETLSAYREMTGYFGKGVSRLWIGNDGKQYRISPVLSQDVEVILGPDIIEEGCVTGYLHQLNIHANMIFHVYSVVPGVPKLTCRFPLQLRHEVVSAVDQYVTVYGALKYKSISQFPY